MSNLSKKNLWALFSGGIYKNKICRPVENYNIREPLVSDYLSKQGFVPDYPGGRKFAVLISHDVDLLNPPVSAWKTSKKVIKNTLCYKFRQSIAHAKNYITYKNPSNYKLDRLFDFLLKENLKTTFFFFALNEKDIDYQYNLEDHEQIIRLLLKNGCEIGLHGSQNACYSYDKILTERDKLKSVLGFMPIGYRNHLLNFDIVNTWKYLENAGFLYDSSLGFNNAIGFRNGMAYPYNPYCENDKRFLGILEFPLNIMDVVFTKQLNYGFNESCRAGIKIIDTVIKQNGVVTLLWHHNKFSGKKKKLLSFLLEYIKNHGGWITTYQEFIKYWLGKNYNNKINEIIKTLLKPEY